MRVLSTRAQRCETGGSPRPLFPPAPWFTLRRLASGEMSEWFKEHAWKVCIGLKPIAGSNPALSANRKE